MHVLVATDGSLDPQKAADFATSLAGSDGSTTVATIVRVPRMLLTDLRRDYGEMSGVAVGSDAEYVGSPSVDTGTPRGWPGDDAVIDQYLGDKRIERCRPIVTAVRDAGGTADSVAVSTQLRLTDAGFALSSRALPSVPAQFPHNGDDRRRSARM